MQHPSHPLPPVSLGKKKKILLIDDHPESVSLLRFSLGRWGFKTKVVCDGYDAIIELIMHRYDLIVIDWIMPEMGGMQTLVHANKSASLDPKANSKKQIPVVIYSAHHPNINTLEKLDHFKIIGHWSKTEKFRSILSNVYDTIQVLQEV